MSTSNHCGCWPNGTPLDACDPEPTQSMVQNMIEKIFGTITKQSVGTRCVWILPCNLDGEIPGYPRAEGIGWACYVNQILEAGIVGEPNTASNLGTGEGWFAQKVAFDLQFKSAVAGLNIELTSSPTEIEVAFEYQAVPAGPAAPGTAGQQAFDDEFWFLCYDTNLWGRIAFAKDWTP